MKTLTIWSVVMFAALLLASTASAATGIAAGQVKGVNADRKEFVLTDAGGRDFTFKLSDQTIMNRGGTESQADLNAGDSVNVFYDKGLLSWSAKYILIREGESKNWELAHGKLKSYEGDKEFMTFTNDEGKDHTYSAAFSRVWVNRHEVSFDDLKIGDSVVLVLGRDNGKPNLMSVMCER